MSWFAALLRISLANESESEWIMRIARIVGLGLALAAQPLVAAPGSWDGSGPFGGQVHAVAADPAVPDRLYAATRNGFFRSLDAGISWQTAEAGLPVPRPFNGVFAIDPDASGLLWLVDAQGRLHRSSDGAASWNATGYRNDFFPYAGRARLAVGHAGGARVLWLATRGGGLSRSDDDGVSFAPVAALAGVEAEYVWAAPAPSTLLLAGTPETDCSGTTRPLRRSVDGGATWTAVGVAGTCQQSLLAAARSAADPNRLYALIGAYYQRVGHLYVSVDAGASWAATAYQGATLAVPRSGGAERLWLDARLSTDGGATFATRAAGITTNGELLPQPVDLIVHPSYPAVPSLWLATEVAGLYASSNDGLSWAPSNAGLAATNIRALAVHPLDGARVYAGFGDAATSPSPALYRRLGGGWTPANNGLDAYQVRGITLDPTSAGAAAPTLYAVGSGADPADGLRNGGLYKSLDGGATWSTIDAGVPSNALGRAIGIVRTLVTDPRSCAAPPASGPCTAGPLRTLYATATGTRGAGGVRAWRVLKSSDAGASWASSDNGLPHDVSGPGATYSTISGAVPLVIDPAAPSTLYVGTFAQNNDYDPVSGTYRAPQIASGVFRSTDGGASWVHRSNGLPRYPGSADAALDVLALAIDPAAPQTLWASTIDTSNWTGPGSLYKTTDGGASWTLANAGITAPDTRALLVDPTTPGTLYAASGGLDAANPGGVFKSVDGGATWRSISLGLPASSATALALDPADPAILHAGTGGGVFTLEQLPDADGDGIPDAVEDAGPNGGDSDGDGIRDALQATVAATAPGAVAAMWRPDAAPAAASAGAEGGWFTVKLIDGDCAQLVDVSAVDSATFPADAGHAHPRGLLRFEAPRCAAATVEVIYHGAPLGGAWSWRLYGPSMPGDAATIGWHDAAPVVVAHGANTWRLAFTAGGFGSYRPASTGSILFVGGPARAEAIFANGFD